MNNLCDRLHLLDFNKWNCLILLCGAIKLIIIISIYKLGDVGISCNLIGSLSLTNVHCPPPGRWIMKQWPA